MRTWWGSRPRTGRTESRLVFRAALVVVEIGYLVFLLLSRNRPFPPSWAGPAVGAGWVPLAGQLLVLGVTRTRLRPPTPARLRALGRRRAAGVLGFALAGTAIAAAAVAVSATAGAAAPCPGPRGEVTCLSVDNWREQDGAYYRQYPYNRNGWMDPDTPWVPVGEAVYVAGEGAHLRLAALYGLLPVELALLLSVAVWPGEAEKAGGAEKAGSGAGTDGEAAADSDSDAAAPGDPASDAEADSPREPDAAPTNTPTNTPTTAPATASTAPPPLHPAPPAPLRVIDGTAAGR